MLFGFILVLLGFSIILKSVFHIDLPLLRTLVALMFIFIGVRMLFGGGWGRNIRWESEDKSTAFFSNRAFTASPGNNPDEYNTFFGKSSIDLTKLPQSARPSEIEINSVFGDTVVYLSPGDSIRIEANAAFGSVLLPNGNSTAFGQTRYESPSSRDSHQAPLNIEGLAVFGSLRFVERNS